MKITIVTNCTARKAYDAPRMLRGRSLPRESLANLAKEWGRRLNSAAERVPAGQLYQGRSFKEAMQAARLVGTPLHVVSAGLGLITEEDRIAPYNLTISAEHPDALARKVVLPEVFRPADWWHALISAGISSRSLTKSIRESPDGIFVLAISSVYLGLLTDELLALSPFDRARVRLIGPRHECDVPEFLRPIHMPYDDRLDGASSPIRGTESDFPQRAALHFVQLILDDQVGLNAEAHKELVKTTLAGWARRRVIARRKLSEPALRKEIAGVLRECDGHWSRALRKLRDQRQVACEQKRFRRICGEILEPRKRLV